jgi:hypothetical protein
MIKRTITLLFLLSVLFDAQGQYEDSTIKVTSTWSKPFPCPNDTIKGVLMWHSENEFNDGNSCDTGYWVGKCGPVGGELVTEGILFIPGIVKITIKEKSAGDKYWRKIEEEHPNEGFRDSQWHKIAAYRVYGLIVDRKQNQ